MAAAHLYVSPLSNVPFRAALVCADSAIRDALLAAWPEPEVEWVFFEKGRDATGLLLTSPPDILLCGFELPDMPGILVASLLKRENVYAQVPVVVCLHEGQITGNLDWLITDADDFIVFPSCQQLLHTRLELVKSRNARTLDANPLTHLPGNTSIIRHTQGLIDACHDFALGYCDLDFFKSFNDKYGFSRGDEVLMMTSRIIVNSIKAFPLEFSFVGHVGGDDFVFIVPCADAENVCQRIIDSFDEIVPQFYDQEDSQRGGIVSTDRQGVLRAFPLMALSIAVVFNKNNSLVHYGEAAQTAMNLKKKAKESPRSNYVFDRRSTMGGTAASSRTEPPAHR